MNDYIIRATAANDQIRAFAAVTTEMVETAREHHNTSPVATAALGRLLTAGAMMGSMMKGEKDVLTLQIKAGGPLQGITVTADSQGNVKGYVGNPDVCIPANSKGKLDVAGAVGPGFLTVIKDMGLKEPYVGQIPLVSGNIAEDITAYYTVSEQIPTVCALGIVFNEDATIKAAGGYMLQLVPPVLDSSVKVIEDNLQHMESITGMLEKGLKPEELAVSALEGLGGEILDQWEAVYYCDCSRERTEQILISLGKKELQKLVDEGEETEVCCHFCNKKYRFSTAEISNLLKEQK